MQKKSPTVLVTRPRKQAQQLCKMLGEAGIPNICFPTIDIQACEYVFPESSFDIYIFTSVYAVEYAKPSLAKKPDHAIALAIGEATANALEQFAWSVDVMPDQFSSEGLLMLSELQSIDRQRVLLVTGVGGRELLVEALEDRGADVARLDVYQRTMPDAVLTSELLAKADIVLATSCESLSNLIDMSGELKAVLLEKSLLVTSVRIKEAAISYGFSEQNIQQAENANNKTILNLLTT